MLAVKTEEIDSDEMPTYFVEESDEVRQLVSKISRLKGEMEILQIKTGLGLVDDIDEPSTSYASFDAAEAQNDKCCSDNLPRTTNAACEPPPTVPGRRVRKRPGRVLDSDDNEHRAVISEQCQSNVQDVKSRGGGLQLLADVVTMSEPPKDASSQPSMKIVQDTL
jgi:hypothetical protein